MSSQPLHLPEGSSLLDLLMNNSTNLAHLPLFLPFIIGYATTQNNSNNSDPVQDSSNPVQDSSNPVQDSSNQPQQTQETLTDRVVLINPLTQSMVVIQSSSSTNLESFFREFFVSKDGQPPASKSSIEAMQSVEIRDDNCEGECVICLENWEVGHVAKEMPCKHMFHEGCIEKWLNIHGSCPICRFNMPVEEVQDSNKSNESEDRYRGIRVSFSIDRSQNSDDNQRGSDESTHS